MNFKKQIVGFLVLIVAIAGLQFTFAQPSIAPTAEVKILGATPQEQTDIENFRTFDAKQLSETSNDIRAASYLVMKESDNDYLFSKRADNPLPIASLTKLLTTWTVLKYGSLNDIYTIQAIDREPISPSLGLKAGDRVLVKDLVNSILIGSANDGALALSHYIEQKQTNSLGTNLPFIELMNIQAKLLGMTNSRFTNPIGFDSVANYSSAHDISILVTELKKTGILELVERSSNYQFVSELGNNYRVEATNKLLASYSDILAVKTGFTNQALGSMVTWIQKNGIRYLVIVIGSPDRETDTLKLRSKL